MIAEYSTGGDFRPVPSVNGRIDGVVTERARSTPHTLVWTLDGEVAPTDSITVRLTPSERPDSAASLGPFVPVALAADPPTRPPSPDAGGDAGSDAATDAASDTASDATDTAADAAADSAPADAGSDTADAGSDG